MENIQRFNPLSPNSDLNQTSRCYIKVLSVKGGHEN